MDWFEFELFIAHLFERLGLGKTEEVLKGSDSGRDIILSSTEGKLIVECKHHQKGSIGRPIVQKLHSAVITANAKKGYLVTTGTFSENAVKYAHNLKLKIELVDLRVLSDMANRAEIKLLKKGQKTSVFHIPPPVPGFIASAIIDNSLRSAISIPNSVDQLAQVKIIEIEFVPAYLLEYDLHQIFSTSVGVVHRINVRGRMLLNGENGRAVPSELSRIVTPSQMIEDWHPLGFKNLRTGSFKLGLSTAKRIGKKHIQKFHTETVGYVGGNNVYYTKKCVPNTSNILIRSLTQVYIPILKVSFNLLSRQHIFSLCGNPETIEILSGTISDCEVCGYPLPSERLLCNSCGKIVHKPRTIRGHSYLCEVCGKTICKDCTFWCRKYLFLKKKVCDSCAETLQKDGITVNKLS